MPSTKFSNVEMGFSRPPGRGSRAGRVGLAGELVDHPLDAEEALRGVTEHAAASLGAGDRGHLRPGAVADLVVLDLPDRFHFGYAFGENPVRAVYRGGARVAV